MVPPSVCSMPGKATFTAVESRLSMKNPSRAVVRTTMLGTGRRGPPLSEVPVPSRVAVTAVRWAAPSTLIGILPNQNLLPR